MNKAEDSDYYTPEDPHTTILSPLYPEKVSEVIILSASLYLIIFSFQTENPAKTKTEIVTPLSALKDADIPGKFSELNFKLNFYLKNINFFAPQTVQLAAILKYLPAVQAIVILPVHQLANYCLYRLKVSNRNSKNK